MKYYSLAVSLLLLLQGCGSDSKKISTNTIQGGELLFEIDAQTLQRGLQSSGWPISGYAVHGYQAYKIPYATKDEFDKDINVSGLLVLPTGLDEKEKEKGLSIVSYGHGTITANDSAPTVFSKEYRSPIELAIVFSSLGGFATLQADYIGYGDSDKSYHPYVMQKSLANTSVDLIHAVKAFAQANNIKLNDQLFVTGYSEGGYTAMSTLKRLEEENISVTAAAPMAGPYNLGLMADVMLGIEEVENLSDYSKVYALLTANAYTKSYDKNLSDFINTDSIQTDIIQILEYYDENGTLVRESIDIDTLLNGNYYIDEILHALPENLVGENALIKSGFVEAYQNDSTHWFKEALQANNVDDWKPNTPIRLVHCQGDDQVPYVIAEQTHTNFLENGVNDIALITPDQEANQQWDHGQCYYPALEFVAKWFVEERDK